MFGNFIAGSKIRINLNVREVPVGVIAGDSDVVISSVTKLHKFQSNVNNPRALGRSIVSIHTSYTDDVSK